MGKQQITLDKFDLENGIPLDTCRGWPKDSFHFFDREQVIAVLAARAVGRPLLVRGEPGCGKTQLARAVAQVLGMPLACLVVNERTETEDLLWRYDALRRLSDANESCKSVEDETVYLSAGPLWWALNHESARKFDGPHSCKPDMAEASNHPRDFENGVVLLIDEIDKADRAVPNSLLEPLGNLSFEVPYTGERVECGIENAPIVIITTNREQELPRAFVRRCLVLDIVLDDSSEDVFVSALARKGEALFKGRLKSASKDETVFRKVAGLLYIKRMKAKNSGSDFLPGQAEYLDHLEALIGMKKFAPGMTEDEAIAELAALTFVKNEG